MYVDHSNAQCVYDAKSHDQWKASPRLRESARGSFRIGVRMTITGPNELSGPNDHVLLECMCIFSQFSEFRISAFRKCPSFQYVYFQSDIIF